MLLAVRRYSTILVATQDPVNSLVAVDRAAELAVEARARLVVLTIMPRLFWHPTDAHSGAMAMDIERQVLVSHQEVVSALPAELSVEAKIAYGRPRQRVLETCASVQGDLIVLAHRPRGGLVAQILCLGLLSVVDRATVPVLVVASDDHLAS